MKKYLSMKYLVGVFALLAAFGMQSFMGAQQKKFAAQTEDMIWFPAIATNETNCDTPNTFDTQNGTAVNPALCNEEQTYCCAIGYPASDCTQTGEDTYELKPSPENQGLVVRRNQ